MKLSQKGLELIKLYSDMAKKGYKKKDHSIVEDAFGDFESRAYRAQLKKDLSLFKIKTILDYGCGGSDWDAKDFDKLCSRDQRDENIQNCY
jgi:hypothetical protein